MALCFNKLLIVAASLHRTVFDKCLNLANENLKINLHKYNNIRSVGLLNNFTLGGRSSRCRLPNHHQ